MKSWLLIFLVSSLSAGGLYSQSNEFARADSVSDRYPNHSLKDLQILADKLTASLSTDKEKFRAIYRWVCMNIEYDESLYMMVSQKRKKLNHHEFLAWNEKASPQVIKMLLDHRHTICTGYAYLVRELAHRAGLVCEIVDGYGKTLYSHIREGVPNHSWNVVMLSGNWYLCDATWSSGYFVAGTHSFVHYFDEKYFLGDPSVFIKNHYPIEKGWSLLENPPSIFSAGN